MIWTFTFKPWHCNCRQTDKLPLVITHLTALNSCCHTPPLSRAEIGWERGTLARLQDHVREEFPICRRVNWQWGSDSTRPHRYELLSWSKGQSRRNASSSGGLIWTFTFWCLDVEPPSETRPPNRCLMSTNICHYTRIDVRGKHTSLRTATQEPRSFFGDHVVVFAWQIMRSGKNINLSCRWGRQLMVCAVTAIKAQWEVRKRTDVHFTW